MSSIFSYIIKHFFRSPTRMAISSFFLLAVMGAVLLSMPGILNQARLSFIDAIFTSISSCSVTGMMVFDAGKDLSFLGQIIVLLLVQIGGVGILIFSTVFILMAGRKPGLIGAMTLKDTYTPTGDRSLSDILKDVLIFTFSIEVIGAGLLLIRFAQQYPFLKALYLSVFHAITAFCNAGISLFANSFIDYRTDWYVNGVLSVLIILGGLGFLVFFDIKKALKNKQRPFWDQISLHSKLALVSTIILLLLSTGTIFLMEMKHSLIELPLLDKILASFFQAVTARTAGFHTIDQSVLSNGTLFILIILMFIGAGAGSCGGGVKITTVSILMILGISHCRGEEKPHIFKKSISKTSLEKAVSTVFLGALIVLIGAVFIEIAEEFNLAIGLGRGKFLDLLFETMSAFSTAGLSTGLTSQLTDIGKMILSALMFIGKLGPLTLAFAISTRKIKKFHYSEENIMIG